MCCLLEVLWGVVHHRDLQRTLKDSGDPSRTGFQPRLLQRRPVPCQVIRKERDDVLHVTISKETRETSTVITRNPHP